MFSYQNSTHIPLGSRIDNVTVCVEWKVSKEDTCGVYVYNGTFVLLDDTCQTTENLYCYDATTHVPNASVANQLGVKVRYVFGSGQGETLYVDHIYVNITYEKYIKPDYWNLTNYTTGEAIPDGANLTRNLKSLGVTTILTEGVSEEGGLLGDEALTEFIADAVIKLDFVPVSERFKRTLTITKMRRTNHSTFIHPFDFTENGLKLVEFGRGAMERAEKP